MEREHFGSRFAVITAFAGSAIGLGNIWRFPYMTGEYGGAAFILVYVAASLILSLPIFFAEFIIGRRSRSNCFGAMKNLAPGSRWNALGLLCVVTPLLIVSYYSVVGGWSLNYLVRSCTLEFMRRPTESVNGIFDSFIVSTWSPLLFFVAYLLLTCGIVATGVKKGIEKFSKYSVPVLFLLVVTIAVYSITIPGAGAGVKYLIRPDMSKITPVTCINALGQSFYSLSLGMGIIITYSSYVSKHENIFVTGVGTAVSDLIFAVIAGFAIMPAVFAAGIEPASGPGLIFRTLPYIFSKMGETVPLLSAVVSILFFLAIFISALSSSIALVEVGVAYLIEEKRFKRWSACVAVFFFCLILGALSSLSFGPLSGFHIAGEPLFDFLDKFSSNILLTTGGFLCVIFAGWKMSRSDVRDEFTNGGSLKLNDRLFGTIYFLMKYVAPIAVAVIFISNFI